MAQCTVVMAFRKRAKKWGYTDVQIYKVYRNGQWVPGRYEVTAVEPLAGERVRIELDARDMACRFKRR